MTWQVWLIYTAAALGLSLSPGPNSLLALTHGALYGLRATGMTILGGSLGFLLVIALSMFGIGAFLQSTPAAWVALQWAGAAYLAWLGVQVWRAPAIRLNLDSPAVRLAASVRFRQGVLAAGTNPKGLLFFAAFLPQFIDPDRDPWVQFIIMASTFVVIEAGVELGLAAMAQRVAAWLARVGRSFNRVCGGLFVALALALPWRG
jgi:homoserine/homoserine lactone efflux protein